MSNSIEAQRKFIEQKKLEAIAKASFGNNTSQSVALKVPLQMEAKKRPKLLVNDGNFLARFQEMQNQAAQKKADVAPQDSQDKTANPGKVTLTLSTAKRKDQPKVLPAKSLSSCSAFEPPSVSGKFI